MLHIFMKNPCWENKGELKENVSLEGRETRDWLAITDLFVQLSLGLTKQPDVLSKLASGSWHALGVALGTDPLVGRGAQEKGKGTEEWIDVCTSCYIKILQTVIC